MSTDEMTLGQRLQRRVAELSEQLPQPAVGTAQGEHPLQNTGSQASDASSGMSFSEGLAGAQTPPAAATPAAGGRTVLAGLSISDNGRLYLHARGRMAIYLEPDEVLALGDFLALTERVWRP